VHRAVARLLPQLLLVLIALTHQTNWLTLDGDDPVPDIDSGSLFHFPRHCGIRDFKRFISISHIDTTDFHDTQRNDRRRQISLMNPEHFGSGPAHMRFPIRIPW